MGFMQAKSAGILFFLTFYLIDQQSPCLQGTLRQFKQIAGEHKDEESHCCIGRIVEAADKAADNRIADNIERYEFPHQLLCLFGTDQPFVAERAVDLITDGEWIGIQFFLASWTGYFHIVRTDSSDSCPADRQDSQVYPAAEQQSWTAGCG